LEIAIASLVERSKQRPPSVPNPVGKECQSLSTVVDTPPISGFSLCEPREPVGGPSFLRAGRHHLDHVGWVTADLGRHRRAPYSLDRGRVGDFRSDVILDA
jgi:hypothetical protein